MMDLPRVLVVTSNNFNQITGGGITLTNLFRGWPVERIANLHEDTRSPDNSVCGTFYKLSGVEVRPIWQFSMIVAHTNEVASLGGGPAGVSGMVKVSRAFFGEGIPRNFLI